VGVTTEKTYYTNTNTNTGTNLTATTTVYSCPSEEGGSSKARKLKGTGTFARILGAEATRRETKNGAVRNRLQSSVGAGNYESNSENYADYLTKA